MDIYTKSNGRFLLDTCREIQRRVSMPKELGENLECGLAKLESWLDHYEIPKELDFQPETLRNTDTRATEPQDTEYEFDSWHRDDTYAH